mmetsp:Transcript_11669/g.43870  ORF Transcript_11669/g.43870 Transcript_11669/m.43870 type:complete len:454 (-) Transcript_11669:238-1599(-)
MSDISFNMFSIYPTCAAFGDGHPKDSLSHREFSTHRDGQSPFSARRPSLLDSDLIHDSLGVGDSHTKNQHLWSGNGDSGCNLSLFNALKNCDPFVSVAANQPIPRPQTSAWDRPLNMNSHQQDIMSNQAPVQMRPATSAGGLKNECRGFSSSTSNGEWSHGSRNVWNFRNKASTFAFDHHQQEQSDTRLFTEFGSSVHLLPPPSSHAPMNHRPQTAMPVSNGCKGAPPFNTEAPEFRPTFNNSASQQVRRSATYSITSQPVKNLQADSVFSQSHKGSKIKLSSALPLKNGACTAAHVAPPSGMADTVKTVAPVTIRPSTSAVNIRGTSSSQATSSRQDNLVKAIYHKLITCQSGTCHRRHSCIQCLECNSLFCEECCHINLQALSFQHCDENDEDWEEYDLRQVPGICSSCAKPSTFSLNLALMKLLLTQDQYKKFQKLMPAQKNDLCLGHLA